jgi:hypothetical protein
MVIRDSNDKPEEAANSSTARVARLSYLDQEGKGVYTSKDKKTSKVFPALEWLAAVCSHIPNGENRWCGITIL